jgi:ABC-type polar amino acid transport system ATPase subunit
VSAGTRPTPPEGPGAKLPAEPILRVSGLRKSFGSLEVLKGVDFAVRPREVAFVIGPSGGGKTTFLRCLNFLETPAAGTIEFDGKQLCHGTAASFHRRPEREIRQARAQMPMVFQHFNLFHHRTVLENVIEGPTVVLKRPRPDAVREARDILSRVGLADKLEAYPAQLSGGQKQRVGIARALAMHPKLILFDEPTSSLDPELVVGVLDTIRRLAEDGMTMIVVSHEMGFARRLADWVYFMADGLIVEAGPPKVIFETPENERVRSFIGSILHSRD